MLLDGEHAMPSPQLTQSQKIMLISVIVITFFNMNLVAYLRASSKKTAQVCGQVVEKYTIMEERARITVMQIKPNDSNINFTISYSNNLFKRIYNPNNSNNMNLLTSTKESDKICIVYNQKYDEALFLVDTLAYDGVRINTPYVYKVSKYE